MKQVTALQPPVKPKRPLSAYNYFFQSERARLLEALPVRAEGKPRRSHGKLGFHDMAKTIGARWKEADDDTKAYFAHFAKQDKERYNMEKKMFDSQRKAHQKDAQIQRPSVVPSRSTPLQTDLEPLSPYIMGSWDPEMSQMLDSLFFRTDSQVNY